MKNRFFYRAYNKFLRIYDYCQTRLLYWLFECTDGEKPCRTKNMLLRILKKNKQIVGFYGECHVYTYFEYFRKQGKLKRKYLFVGNKDIEYLARWHSKYIKHKSTWNNLDVLIYNPGVPQRNNAPSLNSVLDWVSQNCKLISVTDAVFKGYMPQHTSRVFENDGYFEWGDKNINKLLGNPMASVSELDYLKSENYYTIEYVNEYFRKQLDLLSKYEKNCVIKISDYIAKFGRQRPLYYSVSHPDTEIMREIARRIIHELGVEDFDDIKNPSKLLYDLHSHGEVIYPSVWIALGLPGDYKSRRIQPGNRPTDNYTFDEYVDAYFQMGKKRRGHG